MKTPPSDRERIARAERIDRHIDFIMLGLGIGCRGTHPRSGVACQLFPHDGECAAVLDVRVITWPGPDAGRKRFANTVRQRASRARRGVLSPTPRAVARDVDEIEPFRAPVAPLLVDALSITDARGREVIEALDYGDVRTISKWCRRARTYQKALRSTLNAAGAPPASVVLRLARVTQTLIYFVHYPACTVREAAIATAWPDGTLPYAMHRALGLAPAEARARVSSDGDVMDVLRTVVNNNMA